MVKRSRLKKKGGKKKKRLRRKTGYELYVQALKKFFKQRLKESNVSKKLLKNKNFREGLGHAIMFPSELGLPEPIYLIYPAHKFANRNYRKGAMIGYKVNSDLKKWEEKGRIEQFKKIIQ